MKRKTLTTAVMAGLTGLAGLASVARANDIEQLSMPETIRYEGNSCATTYNTQGSERLCWEDNPMVIVRQDDGCKLKYYGPHDKKLDCEARLEDLPIPEQTYR